MKHISKIAFFLVGLAAFCYLVWQFGVDQIIGNAQKAGWSLMYIIGVWLVVYLLNTVSWRLALGSYGGTISFPRLFAVTVSGFVLNYITPVIAIGGEPYKVKALSSRIDPKQSLSAVVLYRMVHLLGHMLLLFSGILLAVVTLALPLAMNVSLLFIGCCICAVILFTVGGHQKGVFERLMRFLENKRLFRHLVLRLRKYEGDLRGMDDIITGVYRNHRGKFYAAVGIEFLSRVCMGVEVYLILNGVGVDMTLISATYLYVIYSIIINVLFFIPMNLGAREGGLYLGLGSLALPPLLGVYLGVIIRLREFFWILLGLLFILFTSSKKEPTAANV